MSLSRVKLPKNFELPVSNGYCLPIAGENGWQINASGGLFKLVAAEDDVSYYMTIKRPSGDYRIIAKYTDSFYIYTARTNKKSFLSYSRLY